MSQEGVVESPAPNVGPCDDSFGGRLLQDFCRDCLHAIGVHRQDHVCSVCDALAIVNTVLTEIYQEIQELKGPR